jgi:transposase
MAVPGVGPLVATALIATVGDAQQFNSGCHLSAWLGLVPREHSSGERKLLRGISKRCDRYLRTLLITAGTRPCTMQRGSEITGASGSLD